MSLYLLIVVLICISLMTSDIELLFSSVFYTFQCRSFTSLVEFTPKYFILFDTILKWEFFWVPFWIVTVGIKACNWFFCMLIMYSATLLNLFLLTDFFVVFRISRCRILSFANGENLLSFWFGCYFLSDCSCWDFQHSWIEVAKISILALYQIFQFFSIDYDFSWKLFIKWSLLCWNKLLLNLLSPIFGEFLSCMDVELYQILSPTSIEMFMWFLFFILLMYCITLINFWLC